MVIDFEPHATEIRDMHSTVKKTHFLIINNAIKGYTTS